MEKETEKRNETLVENNNRSKVERKPYEAPRLSRYGSLTELVRNNPGSGGDGFFDPNCTRT
jgi:hypothetical protein